MGGQVFADMQSVGMRPNTVTYNTLISACDTLEGALSLFAEMQDRSVSATVQPVLSKKTDFKRFTNIRRFTSIRFEAQLYLFSITTDSTSLEQDSFVCDGSTSMQI